MNVFGLKSLLVVVITANLLACSDGGNSVVPAQNEPLVEPAESANGFGPLAVGHQRLEAFDENRGNRHIPYDVWYPVDLADASDEPRTIYPLQGPFGLTAERAVEDLPVSRARLSPFLVFSHGGGGTNTQSVLLMETLASHGFIVVAPEHTGNTNDDSSDSNEEALNNRVPDVSFIIDTFLGRNQIQGDDFFERVDAENIGALGHSVGGGTALGTVAGFGTAAADERVKAVMPVSGTISGIISAEALAAVEEPVLLMGGTLDTSVPIENNDFAFDALTASAAVFQADIIGATHTQFANICDIGNWLIDNGISQDLWADIGAEALLEPYAEACGPDAFPIEEVQRIQNLYAVAFFRRYLLGQEEYDYYLQPEYAAAYEPNVAYRVKHL